MAPFQGIPQYETGLGHGAFYCIHQQHHAIDHVHDPFHLAAKVSMARRVHNVDGGIAIDDARVFG